MKNISIILPENIYILKEKPIVTIKSESEEYNIYFENIIYPYSDAYDVLVDCEYGMNLGKCWRINEYPKDISDFPLTIKVYDEYGELLCSRKTTVHLVEKKKHKDFMNVLCIGDSMTRSQKYLEHILHKLNKISFIGTRTYDGTVYHEGRGGWSYDNYFELYEEKGIGVSPFLFPKDIDAKKYAGEYKYIEETKEDDIGNYWLEGFVSKPIEIGDFFLKDGVLTEKTETGDKIVNTAPEFEFSFSKYAEKNNIKNIDAISVLLGANDLQVCPYEESEERILKYIAHTKELIRSVREYDKNVPIIINLPIISGEDHHWGLQKLRTGSKAYKHNILKACEKLLEIKEENIYLSPMLATLDIKNGFSKLGYASNMYSESVEIHQNNWVHPNVSGYAQMGDALAAILEMLHNKG